MNEIQRLNMTIVAKNLRISRLERESKLAFQDGALAARRTVRSFSDKVMARSKLRLEDLGGPFVPGVVAVLVALEKVEDMIHLSKAEAEADGVGGGCNGDCQGCRDLRSLKTLNEKRCDLEGCTHDHTKDMTPEILSEHRSLAAAEAARDEGG